MRDLNVPSDKDGSWISGKLIPTLKFFWAKTAESKNIDISMLIIFKIFYPFSINKIFPKSIFIMSFQNSPHRRSRYTGLANIWNPYFRFLLCASGRIRLPAWSQEWQKEYTMDILEFWSQTNIYACKLQTKNRFWEINLSSTKNEVVFKIIKFYYNKYLDLIINILNIFMF